MRQGAPSEHASPPAVVGLLRSRPVGAFGPGALVAQLDRASDYGSEGWGFESLRARNTSRQISSSATLRFLQCAFFRALSALWLLCCDNRPRWTGLLDCRVKKVLWGWGTTCNAKKQSSEAISRVQSRSQLLWYSN
jgi:hypothetical protein